MRVNYECIAFKGIETRMQQTHRCFAQSIELQPHLAGDDARTCQYHDGIVPVVTATTTRIHPNTTTTAAGSSSGSLQADRAQSGLIPAGTDAVHQFQVAEAVDINLIPQNDDDPIPPQLDAQHPMAEGQLPDRPGQGIVVDQHLVGREAGRGDRRQLAGRRGIVRRVMRRVHRVSDARVRIDRRRCGAGEGEQVGSVQHRANPHAATSSSIAGFGARRRCLSHVCSSRVRIAASARPIVIGIVTSTAAELDVGPKFPPEGLVEGPNVADAESSAGADRQTTAVLVEQEGVERVGLVGVGAEVGTAGRLWRLLLLRWRWRWPIRRWMRVAVVVVVVDIGSFGVNVVNGTHVDGR